MEAEVTAETAQEALAGNACSDSHPSACAFCMVVKLEDASPEAGLVIPDSGIERERERLIGLMMTKPDLPESGH